MNLHFTMMGSIQRGSTRLIANCHECRAQFDVEHQDSLGAFIRMEEKLGSHALNQHRSSHEEPTKP